MPRPESFWIQFQKTFNPNEVLAGRRGQELFCKREHSPFEEMKLDFRPGSPSRVGFFTGHRGSGKSSMLLRLLQHLKDDYFLVYFDIEHNLDSAKANQIDLLFLLGAAIYRTGEIEGLPLREDLLQQLVESIFTLNKEIKGTEKNEFDYAKMVKEVISFGASFIGGGEIVKKLAEAALNPFTISSGVSEEIARKREIDPQVQRICGIVRQIADEIEKLSGKEVFAIVDGLDKLQHFKQAESIFIESRALRERVCRLIYTVPMLIYRDQRFAQVEQECGSYFYPSIKLYEKDDDTKIYEDGYQILREVVSRRLATIADPEPGITIEDLFEKNALDDLILMSGGLMRLFINLVQNAGKRAELMGLDRISSTAARQAIEDEASRSISRLSLDSIEELQKVRQNKMPSKNSEEVNNLLHGLQIVAYRGPSTWFDVHPLLWEELSDRRKE